MSRTDELWQDMQEAEQSQYEAECCRAEYDRDMEPHKREGYFEMMCDMADYQRKWIREEGI